VVTVDKLRADDRAQWEALFRAYIDFYGRREPLAMYDRAWDEFLRDERLHARVARIDDRLIGIVHFLVHPSTSSDDVCYLQDLFTAPEARGRGVGGTLIGDVADWARQRGCVRLYWQTQASNVRARRLYDSVAEDSGFVVYRMSLS
jgi:GNAT superfamily N-acetyltransferase